MEGSGPRRVANRQTDNVTHSKSADNAMNSVRARERERESKPCKSSGTSTVCRCERMTWLYRYTMTLGPRLTLSYVRLTAFWTAPHFPKPSKNLSDQRGVDWKG